ncbi:dTDP-4-dehydrorhamnose 3,5-epimerase [Parerythrobacter aurantius]|uniref:dTDP-4-dehydrorhamnose 3,5-epimerase n=1 Tax=Parerythrobacter aurantius TaxID=3127706 RepID=UPI00324CA3CD
MSAFVTDLPLLLVPKRFGDARGWFSESYSRRWLLEHGIDIDFVQDNQSYSAASGTLRGLHFQTPPHSQAKLVRCLVGAIWDVAVDIRLGSPTFGQWVAAELSAEGGEQLYVPVGFAHGFLTLAPDVEVAYKTSDYYAPDCDGGLAWDDPDIGISWPLYGAEPVLSDKDRRMGRLADFASPFLYEGAPLAELDRSI